MILELILIATTGLLGAICAGLWIWLEADMDGRRASAKTRKRNAKRIAAARARHRRNFNLA